jgi:hypothetical protein
LGLQIDIRVFGEVVFRIVYAISVFICVARVAYTVAVKVRLVLVDDGGAVVCCVGDAVVIVVQAPTSIAPAIAIRIELVGIAGEWAVVLFVWNGVVIIIDIADIAHAIAVCV